MASTSARRAAHAAWVAWTDALLSARSPVEVRLAGLLAPTGRAARLLAVRPALGPPADDRETWAVAGEIAG